MEHLPASRGHEAYGSSRNAPAVLMTQEKARIRSQSRNHDVYGVMPTNETDSRSSGSYQNRSAQNFHTRPLEAVSKPAVHPRVDVEDAKRFARNEYHRTVSASCTKFPRDDHNYKPKILASMRETKTQSYQDYIAK